MHIRNISKLLRCMHAVMCQWSAWHQFCVIVCIAGALCGPDTRVLRRHRQPHLPGHTLSAAASAGVGLLPIDHNQDILAVMGTTARRVRGNVAGPQKICEVSVRQCERFG